MVKCTFCQQEIEKGTGLMYVQKDGKILWFNSKKCEKNMLKMGRKAQNLKWVTSALKDNKKKKE